MGTATTFRVTLRRLVPLLVPAAVAACVSAGSREVIRLDDRGAIAAAMDSLAQVRLEQQLAERGRSDGPRVRIWTDDGVIGGSQIRASFRLDDDAYVAVFNVGPDGRVRAVFPGDPEDHGFLRGGHTYRLPEFFPGFGAPRGRSAFGSRFALGSYSNAGFGSYADPLYEHAGYVFVVASWVRLRFDELEAMDGWDSYRFATRSTELQPVRLMRTVGDLLVPRGRRWYSVDYRYYGDRTTPYGGYAESSQCAYASYLMPDLGWLRYGIATGRFSRDQLIGMFNRLSFTGCGDGLTRIYRTLLLTAINQPGYGPNPGTPPPPAPVDSLAGRPPSSGATSGIPTRPPRTEREPRRPKIDSTGASTVTPNKGRPGAGEDDDVIELGGERPRTAPPRGRRTWTTTADEGVLDVPRERTRSPREERVRAPRGDDVVVRLPAPRGEAVRARPSAGEASGGEERVSRPRPEPRHERLEVERPQPRAEQPRAEQPPRSEPPRSEPPRAEPRRSEPPPRPVSQEP